MRRALLVLALLALTPLALAADTPVPRFRKDYYGPGAAELAGVPHEMAFACAEAFGFLMAPYEYPGACFGTPYDRELEVHVVDATGLPVGFALWWVEVEGETASASTAGIACDVFEAPYARAEFIRVLPLDAARSAEACGGAPTAGAIAGEIQLWF